VFHVEQSFVGHWQRYQQVLKQRNAALKAHQPRAIVSVWDTDLVRSGELLSDARARYVATLGPRAEAIGRNLLGMELSLSYRSGWPKDQSMAEALLQSWSHDQEAGATQIGRIARSSRFAWTGLRSKTESPEVSRSCWPRRCSLLRSNCSRKARRAAQPAVGRPRRRMDDERLAGLIREVSSQSVQLIVTTLHGEFPRLASLAGGSR